MIVIPNMELRDGACVMRPLADTDPSVAVHPIARARAWAHAGFQRLSVVDLDADGGTGSNAALVEEIICDDALALQVGGGVESTDHIERFVDAGANLIVVGSRAVQDPHWFATVAEFFPGMLVVSTDVRARRVVTRGWVRSLPFDILDLVEELDGLPLGGLLVSSLGTNGHHTATDLALLEDVVERCAFPVFTSGGVTTMDDLRALEHRGIAAVLLGAALHSGELDTRAVSQEFGA